ncbi:MAG TPA: hypothetical protein VGM90_11365 [Kofleriaceae bacterium]|jgi:TM2 domain-containing membrane protein YozV
MSKALVRRESSSGLLPAIASAIIPGVGQLINGETNKAIGVGVVYLVAGASFLGAIPLIGSVAGAFAAATWLYAVADGYITGKKKG